MRMSFGQEMRMAQKQVLAPRMIQSMEILQLPVMALEERIEEEIQNNETLEVEEAGQDAPVVEALGTAVEAEPSAAERTVDEKPLIVDQDHANQADFERTYDWANEYPDSDDDRSRPSASQIEQAGDRYLDVMANMAERPETLCDHLHAQVANYDLSPAEREAADKVIYNLDANGYLSMPLDELVEADGPPDQIAHLTSALAVVQSMDPPGVGARDLRECLLLQIRHDMPNARQLRRLVRDHLEDLAGNRLPLITRKTGMSIEEIEMLREQLHDFKPKPGAVFSTPVVVPVKPDVYVDQMPDGTWKVRLEEIDLPNLRISPLYRDMLMSPETDTSDAVPRRWARGDRAAEDAADRRPDRDARDHGEPRGRRQVAADAAWDPFAPEVLRRRHGERRRRGGRLGRGADETPGDRRRGAEGCAVQRRRPRPRTGQAGDHGRPPDGHQVSQGDEDPQFPAAARLETRPGTPAR